MAVVQPLHQLAHEAADMLMGELDQARLQQAHQVMVHVLKHQVKSTFVLLEVKCILLVSDNLLHVDHTSVFELPQDLDLSDGCDGETLLFIVQTYFLQSDQFTSFFVLGLVHLAVGAFPYDANNIEFIYTAFAPVTLGVFALTISHAANLWSLLKDCRG